MSEPMRYVGRQSQESRKLIEEYPFEIAFDCYFCGIRNTIQVEPLEEEWREDGILTLYYADTIYFSCPHCGQKYAFPNSEKVRNYPHKR